MGVERLVGLFEECGGIAPDRSPDIYVVAVGDAAIARGFEVAEMLRESIDGISVELNLGGGSFKSQLKRADRSGAEYAVVLGDDEVAEDRAGLKPLRTDEDQIQVRTEQVAKELSGRLIRNTG